MKNRLCNRQLHIYLLYQRMRRTIRHCRAIRFRSTSKSKEQSFKPRMVQFFKYLVCKASIRAMNINLPKRKEVNDGKNNRIGIKHGEELTFCNIVVSIIQKSRQSAINTCLNQMQGDWLMNLNLLKPSFHFVCSKSIHGNISNHVAFQSPGPCHLRDSADLPYFYYKICKLVNHYLLYDRMCKQLGLLLTRLYNFALSKRNKGKMKLHFTNILFGLKMYHIFMNCNRYILMEIQVSRYG